MAQKHVLVTFSHAPYGSIYYTEGLRAAVGVTAGTDEHTVDLVYVGDGVYYALKGVDRTDTNKYLGSLTKGGYKLKAHKGCLEARRIRGGEVAEDVEVISDGELLSLIQKADHTIDF